MLRTITAKKGKDADAPTVSIQDPLYTENPTIAYWVKAYSEATVQAVFLKARQVIIQRVGRSTLNDKGTNTLKAEAAMTEQAKDISIRRTATPSGLTEEQVLAAMTAAGHDVRSAKVQKVIASLFPKS